MRRTFRLSLLAAASLALVASACTTERDLNSLYDQGEDLPEGFERAGALRNLTEGARLAGDIGPVVDLNHEAELTEWNDTWSGDYGEDYRYDSVQLDVYDGSKWAMVQLNFNGGLDHASLQPGNSLTFSGYNYWEPESDMGGEEELYVDAIGCSSDDDMDMSGWLDEGDAYFDAPAEEILIDVYEGAEPNTKILDIRTVYADGKEAQAGIVVPDRG